MALSKNGTPYKIKYQDIDDTTIKFTNQNDIFTPSVQGVSFVASVKLGMVQVRIQYKPTSTGFTTLGTIPEPYRPIVGTNLTVGTQTATADAGAYVSAIIKADGNVVVTCSKVPSDTLTFNGVYFYQ